MRKYLLSCLLVLLFLNACAALKPPERKVVGNILYCSHPRMEVEVSPELEYVGERQELADVEEIHRAEDFVLSYPTFLFANPNHPNQMVGISILKAHYGASWLEPSFDHIENLLEIGKSKLGKHLYHYGILKEGNQLCKIYLRNASGASIQVRIVYCETTYQEVSSNSEKLREFNTNCANAFTVK